MRKKFSGKGENKELIGGKYHWLEENELETTEWKELRPQSPEYLFMPQNLKYEEEYEQFSKITDIFLNSANGFKTHRDHFSVAFNSTELSKRIKSLINKEINDSDFLTYYQLKENKNWTLQKARNLINRTSNWKHDLVQCLYRPFDRRFCYHNKATMDRPRDLELSHARHPNFCLAIGRQGQAVGNDIWNLITVGKNVADTNLFYRGGIQYFSLYLYPTEKEPTLFDLEKTKNTPGDRRPNLSEEFIKDFSQRLKLKYIPDGKGDRIKTFAPEDIFAYIYAVFHSPTYRDRYSEFLKTDFPRLPLTSQPKLFKQLCDLGDRLIELHLMEKHGDEIASYPIEGDDIVDKVRYSEPKQKELGKVWINETQYFDGVPPEVWDFYIGGYQVCQKWLKDRKERTLSYEDLIHYQNIVSAISETTDLMEKIDRTIDNFGGFPIK